MKKIIAVATLVFLAGLSIQVSAAPSRVLPAPVPASSGLMIAASVAAPASANDLAAAMEVPAGDIVSASIEGSDPAGVRVVTGLLGKHFPRKGNSFVILSTGLASSADTPNSSGNTSSVLDGFKNSQGNDMTQLHLKLKPPAGSSCLAFDAAFYSEEFPEFVGSQFNDAFTAEKGGSSFQITGNQVVAPRNFAFDSAGNPISVNTVFGVTADTGTTYDGATPLLRVVTPLGAGDFPETDVMLTVQDLGDSVYDSAVFLDNFAWLHGVDCKTGALLDSDGDGLLDVWETDGIDTNGDGTIDIDLKAMGADPRHKDIFVESDYMVDKGTCIFGICFGGHSHKMKADALKIAIDTFKNAPLSNPDGTTGINIHIDAGPDTVMNPVTGALWGSLSKADEITHVDMVGTYANNVYDWTAFDAIKKANFSIFRKDVFHYNLAAHKFDALGHSGLSRDIPASDFIISLGDFDGGAGSTFQQAGTFIHELGHNLGLGHGGGDGVNYKPNYLSAMNYSFQLDGLIVNGNNGNFDYSGNALPSLNKASLNEATGIFSFTPLKTLGTHYYCSGNDTIENNATAVDWNCDGDKTDTGVAADINDSGSSNETLAGYDDWANLHFDGGAVGKLGQTVDLPMSTNVEEITLAENSLIKKPYSVSVTGPGVIYLMPGSSKNYRFDISNRGQNPDTYTLSAVSLNGWANLAGLAANISLAAGETKTVQIPVTVPAGTAAGIQDGFTLKAQSANNSLLSDTGYAYTIVSLTDTDGDGIADQIDNCPAVANPNQEDGDGNGIGMVCDPGEQKATLTVINKIVPTTDTGKFNLLIDGAVKAANVGNGGTTGVVTVAKGVHTISQTAGINTILANYITVIGGDCAANGSITINPGDNKICTITNTRIDTGTLTIVKKTGTANGTFSFKVAGPTASLPVVTTASGTGTTGSLSLNVGQYTLSEIVPVGWSLTGLSCSVSCSGSCSSSMSQINFVQTFKMQKGMKVTCTFTNKKK